MTDVADAATPRPSRPRLPEPRLEGRQVNWSDTDTAPQDGKGLWLKVRADGEVKAVEALWRHTRRWDRIANRWLAYGYWARVNTNGLAVVGEILAWAPQHDR